MKLLRRYSFPFIVLALLSGCGEEYKSDTSIQTGVFRDSPVQGLWYEGQGSRGYTDSQGRFSYIPGNSYSFGIGKLVLGTAQPLSSSETVTPGRLALSFPTGQRKDAMIGLTRLLMTADYDRNPANGIRIFTPLDIFAQAWGNIPAEFVLDLANHADAQTVLAGIRAAYENPTLTYVTEAQAASHLNTSMSCAYSGAFYGVLADGSRTALVLDASRKITLIQYMPETGALHHYEAVDPFLFSALEADINSNRVEIEDAEQSDTWLRYSHDLSYPDYVGISASQGGPGNFPAKDKAFSRFSGWADATRRYAGMVRSTPGPLGRDYVFVVETYGKDIVSGKIVNMQSGESADIRGKLSKTLLTATAYIGSREIEIKGTIGNGTLSAWNASLTEKIDGISPFTKDFSISGCKPAS